jgi:hypothetical protein
VAHVLEALLLAAHQALLLLTSHARAQLLHAGSGEHLSQLPPAPASTSSAVARTGPVQHAVPAVQAARLSMSGTTSVCRAAAVALRTVLSCVVSGATAVVGGRDHQSSH